MEDPSRKEHHRRSIRLHGRDYSAPGAYFVTLCTQDRVCLFGDVVEGEMRLNDAGRIAHEEWLRTARLRRNVLVDQFVIMPNHVHGIVTIEAHEDLGSTGTDYREPATKGCEVAFGPPPLSLGAIIAGFKSASTRRINGLRGAVGARVWQRNYYEHIIRDETSLAEVREYIAGNPQHWQFDSENSACTVAFCSEP